MFQIAVEQKMFLVRLYPHFVCLAPVCVCVSCVCLCANGSDDDSENLCNDSMCSSGFEQIEASCLARRILLLNMLPISTSTIASLTRGWRRQ